MNISKTRRIAGFTLVEILVVIGIIMLLSAVLFPVLSRSRENARRSSCMNNLRQVALGIQQYVQDNNRRYPPPPAEPVDGSQGWALIVADQIKSDAIFQCPSEPSKAHEGFTDYWMNGELLGVHEIRLRNPSNIILNGDGSAFSVDYELGPTAEENWDPTDEYATRHLGGANFSFADGHVKWLNPNQVSTIEPPSGSNFTFLPR